MYNYMPIDYNLNSLEPYLDEETLDIHYNKIYKKYINTLNELLKNNNFKFNMSLQSLVQNIDTIPLNIRGEVLYNLGGILNHSLYFYNISNKSNKNPIGKIKEDINKYFGSYENFKKQFIEKANNLKGSGYTFLVKDKDNNLKIINTSNQDTPYSYGYTPIISLDLWEHSYYLKYKNNRKEYINNFFNIIDFNNINKYYEELLNSK